MFLKNSRRKNPKVHIQQISLKKSETFGPGAKQNHPVAF